MFTLIPGTSIPPSPLKRGELYNPQFIGGWGSGGCVSPGLKVLRNNGALGKVKIVDSTNAIAPVSSAMLHIVNATTNIGNVIAHIVNAMTDIGNAIAYVIRAIVYEGKLRLTKVPATFPQTLW